MDSGIALCVCIPRSLSYDGHTIFVVAREMAQSSAPWVLSLAPSLGGPVIHPIADYEHPLLCLLGPSILSQKTAISGSFQQNLASVCNGVRVWKVIMGWIPGYGNL